MENKEELKQKLIEKLEKELQEYKGYLRQKSPDEIIESAYQMTVKTLIIGEMSEKNLDYYELKALIKQKDLLAEFYEDWRNSDGRLGENISYEMVPLEQAYSSFEAGRMEGESVKWNEASGKISLEYVYLYPPGIPMIVPGERITSTIVQKMVKYKEMGFSIEGLSQENCLLVAGNPE